MIKHAGAYFLVWRSDTSNSKLPRMGYLFTNCSMMSVEFVAFVCEQKCCGVCWPLILRTTFQSNAKTCYCESTCSIKDIGLVVDVADCWYGILPVVLGLAIFVAQTSNKFSTCCCVPESVLLVRLILGIVGLRGTLVFGILVGWSICLPCENTCKILDMLGTMDLLLWSSSLGFGIFRSLVWIGLLLAMTGGDVPCVNERMVMFSCWLTSLDGAEANLRAGKGRLARGLAGSCSSFEWLQTGQDPDDVACHACTHAVWNECWQITSLVTCSPSWNDWLQSRHS